MVEQICDYFAGCLLMPRPWVKRLYCSGTDTCQTWLKRLAFLKQPCQFDSTEIGFNPTCSTMPSGFSGLD